jgi:hypothetical protein
VSQPEWVEPHRAAHRLAEHWDISSQIAQQIVRGVLRSGEVLVHGRGRGLVTGSGFADTSLRIISKEIGTTLNPGSLISWEFSDVEMDWNGLLKQGRNLVPREYEYWVSAAIEKLKARSEANDRATVSAETEMKIWLRQQADEPPGRKADIFKWAKSGELIGEKGKTLGHRSFDRAWNQAAPPSWKRPGIRTRVLQLSEIKSRDNQIKTPR